MTESAAVTLEQLLASTPELSKTDLAYLQEWMSKQAHLPTITDLQLVPFLHSCYYSLERTKTTIENYFTMRTHAPELFGDRDPMEPISQGILNIIYVASLSKRDAKGNYILCSHLLNDDSSLLPFTESLKVVLMITDIIIRDNPTSPGYICVLDMAGIGLGHVTKASMCMSVVKKFMMYIQEAFPFRMKEVHIINATTLADTIVKIIKPFLNKELANLLHFHSGDMTDFYKMVPRELLPKEFDGELDSLQIRNDLMRKKLEQNRALFLDECNRMRVDESKRQGKPRGANEIFGIEGSFKQLSID